MKTLLNFLISNVHFLLTIYRSHEVEILQLTDLLVGATAYVNRGLANSKAKNELINLIKHRSKYSLTKSTLLKERKFNVFIWEPQKPYFV